MTQLWDILRDAGWLLFLFSLQAALIFGICALAARLMRRRSAADRHNVWLGGVAVTALLPVWLLLSWLVLPPPVLIDDMSYAVTPDALLRLASQMNTGEPAAVPAGFLAVILPAAALLWLAGFIASTVGCGIAYRRIRRIVKDARAGDEIVAEAGLTENSVRVLLSPAVTNSFLAGVFRPVILLPQDLAEWTDAGERRAILLHEAAHLARRDQIVNIVCLALKSVFFFHPAVRYGLRRISFERELACDERLIAGGVPVKKYSEIILKMAEYDVSGTAGAQPAFTSKKQLKERVENIMSYRNDRLASVYRYLLPGLTLIVVAAGVWFVTPERLWAQTSEKSSAAPATDEVTAEFARLYTRVKDAMVKGDGSALNELLADDYTAVSMRGESMTRQQVIEGHSNKANPAVKLEAVDFSDFKVRTHGTTVVVTYRADVTGTAHGGKFTHGARITDIWEKKDGKWRSVASHASNIEK